MFKRLLLSTLAVALTSGVTAAQDNCEGVTLKTDKLRGNAAYMTPMKISKGSGALEVKHIILLSRAFNKNTDTLTLSVTAYAKAIMPDGASLRGLYLEFEGEKFYRNDTVAVQTADIPIVSGVSGIPTGYTTSTVNVDAELKELLLTRKLLRAGVAGFTVTPASKFSARLMGWTQCLLDKTAP